MLHDGVGYFIEKKKKKNYLEEKATSQNSYTNSIKMQWNEIRCFNYYFISYFIASYYRILGRSSRAIKHDFFIIRLLFLKTRHCIVSKKHLIFILGKFIITYCILIYKTGPASKCNYLMIYIYVSLNKYNAPRRYWMHVRVYV